MPDNRQVHARKPNGIEVVRYDREGRWYVEDSGHRMRLATVHAAVSAALVMASEGGEIFLGRPGGKKFDYMIEAARAKAHR